jgi:hypothetical protein
MATKIITKTGSGAPTTSEVDRGELAVDLTNKQLYTSDGTEVIKLGSGSGEGQWSLASNGDDIYYNDGNVGIGREPTNTLDLVGGITVQQAADIKWQNTARDATYGGIKSTASKFSVTWDGSDKVTVDANGDATFDANLAYFNSVDDAAQVIVSSRNAGDGFISQTRYHSKSAGGANVGGAIGHDGDNLCLSGVTSLTEAKHVTIDNNGNVGIGTDNPSPNGPLSIERDGANSTEFNISLTNGTNDKECVVNFGKDLSNSDRYRGRVFYQVDNDVMGFWTAATERMRIDADGKVGIGGQPSRSAEEIAKEAKDTLASWKSTFDERLKAEPKADKKAVTLEITDDAFEVLPTEEALAEWMETRAAGDKLQVNGSGSFSGSVTAGSASTSQNGVTIYHNGVVYASRDTSGDVSVWRGFGAGVETSKINSNGDATFSGTVNSGALRPKYGASTDLIIDAKNAGGTTCFSVDARGDGNFFGTVNSTRILADHLVQDGAPVVDSLQIIRAFMKLRDAVDDPDSSVEELRDKLKVAVVDIIDQFQELVDAVEPEVSTMPAPEDS